MIRSLLPLSILLCLAGAAPAATAPSATHPFTVHDMLAMDRIGDPQVSPDGRRIVFVESHTDLEHNRRRSDLWLVGADGSGLRALTARASGDNSPRWSSDGRSVWFLSSRSGSSQVWRIPVDGGEAQQVTKLPLDVNAFLPAPGDERLVVAIDVFPGTSLEQTKKRLDETEEREKTGPTGRLYDRLFIRHWDTWNDGRRSHLFAVPVKGGAPVDLLRRMDADCPSKPFGGVEEIAFDRDGRTVLFTAKDAGREEAWSTNFDLYAVPIDGSAAPRNLTPDNPAWDTQPVFSPDGRTLAWLAMSVPGYEADRFRIMLRSWPDGRPRELAPSWDRSPESIVWSADGRTIFAVAENLGQASLFAIDAATGRTRVVVEKGTARSPAVAGERVVVSLEDLRSPAELYSVAPDGGDLRALTHVNAAQVAAARMGEPEQFTFEGWNGETVYGYVVKPVDFDPARKYPVAFLIHGGPQGSFGNDFHYRWNPQAYSGAGYATVSVDFHGSSGYGQAFEDAIRGDYGGKTLEDLQKGLEAALRSHPWMDGNRVGALGASFGGYMINWILGNWPDRFRCLVSHDGNLDEKTAYYDTEELWFPEHDHEGTPWENPRQYETPSPINYVGKWKTPTLVVHGGQDFRIPYPQGISTFTALQRRGVPSEFLFFPDENHWVLKPRNSVLWHDTVIGWLDRWLKK
ncbi:MAG TPA: S9 family peptidase [Terriglobales bacterium]|nr:S9 family peptidase [Terriglobales bacterium]